MNVIPAKIAGVERVCIVTPPDKDGNINSLVLAAAWELGIDEVYCCGGAQAIAALAYGTETIGRVDMIAGPGNIFMTLAKKLLYGIVGIDKLAGPSDSLILADETADPEFAAADMITQAEHDPQASSILICNDKKLAEKIKSAVVRQVNKLERKETVKSSFTDNGLIIVIKNNEDFISLTNMIAPEHLQIMTKHPEVIMNAVENAGAIFLGAYSPEVLGDYLAGPNHVLPTGGTARFASPLSVDDFIKKSSIIKYDKSDLKKVSKSIEILSKIEGLSGHANSVNIRFKK
jgi:histidinol dehydrogenase